MDTHRRGRRFEELAAAHLKADGYRIVDRNVREGREEIDLVLRRGSLVVFVEVRGRSSLLWGHPFQTIGHRKRAAVARVAKGWIARHGRPGDRYRFDAVSIVPGAGGWTVEHLPDAWWVGGHSA